MSGPPSLLLRKMRNGLTLVAAVKMKKRMMMMKKKKKKGQNPPWIQTDSATFYNFDFN
jgi:hypothetical protein